MPTFLLLINLIFGILKCYMKEKAEVIKYYNNFSKRQGLNKRHFNILRLLINSGLKTHHDILEIGCGIGTLTQLLGSHLKNGTIIAIDISPESIEIAKNSIKKLKNVELIAEDITTYDFGNRRFDVAILPDVLEHIPFELHFNLFKKISEILKNDGFVFIHIPNPHYLDWCTKHKPELLQIIDQAIFPETLIKNVSPNGFYIQELKTYSIWIKDGDYQYIILRKQIAQNFNIQISEKKSNWNKIKQKIKSFYFYY